MDNSDQNSTSSSSQISDTQRDDFLRQQAIDKKKIKLLKKALKEEISQRQKYEQDLEKASTKLNQMQKSVDEKEEKYLKLYQENVNIHEKLADFQSNINSGGALNISEENKSQLNSGGYNAWDQHYKDVIQKLQDTLQQKDLQNLQYQAQLRKSNMEMEFVQQQFKEAKLLLKQRSQDLDDLEGVHRELMHQKDLQIKELEQKIQDLERRVTYIRTDFEKAGQRENLKEDEVLKLKEVIDEKEQMIEEYRQQIWELKEDQMNKEQVIEALSNSLSQKGDEAADLAQKLAVIKNQLIDAGTFDQRYLVTKKTNLGTVDRYFQFLRDTEEEGEFFLQITKKDGSNRKRIHVLLIERIENQDGHTFNLIVQEVQDKDDNRFKSQKSGGFIGMLKPKSKLNPFAKGKKGQPIVLTYDSEHLQPILESFKKVRLLAMEKAQQQAQMMDELMKETEQTYEIIQK
eukprot:403334307